MQAIKVKKLHLSLPWSPDYCMVIGRKQIEASQAHNLVARCGKGLKLKKAK